MAVRKHKSHGKWVWQARVAYQGRRRSVYRATKNEAKEAEAQLLQDLKKEREQAEQAEQAPATLRMLLEHYVADLEQRGKGADTVIRASSTAKMIERVTPALLHLPVSAIRDADIFAFRNDHESVEPQPQPVEIRDARSREDPNRHDHSVLATALQGVRVRREIPVNERHGTRRFRREDRTKSASSFRRSRRTRFWVACAPKAGSGPSAGI